MKKLITTMLLAISIIAGYAQTTRYSFHKEGGQFTPLDANDPAIISRQIYDDFFFKVKIGFPFKFNGAYYDSVGISENGWIWFGGAQPADLYKKASYLTKPISADLPQSVAGVVSAMGVNLHPQMYTSLTTTIRYGIVGTDHFCIEWRNTSRIENLSLGVDEDTMSFQINLYKEEFNRIDIIYNPVARFGLHDHAAQDHPQVGIKGATLSDFTNRMTDATHGWGNTLPGTSVNSACKLSIDTNPSMSLYNFMVWYYDKPVGIAKNELVQSSINVYPVPAKDIVYLEMNESNQGTIAYEVYNLQGQLMSKGNTSNNSITINELEEGIYFLKVFSGESVYTSKIVKN